MKSADVRDDTLSGGGLGSQDIADGTLTGADISDNSLDNNDILASSLFNDDSLTGADVDETTLSGFNPDAVGPRLYARVEAAGNVTEGDTKGLTDATVGINGGAYCFETGFDVNTIAGVAESGSGPAVDRFIAAYNQGGPPCGVNDDAMVFVYDVSDAAGTIAANFYVEMN